MTPHQLHAPFIVVEAISLTSSVTVEDVFAIFHYLIQADHELTGHELWMLAHEIAYPTVDRIAVF